MIHEIKINPRYLKLVKEGKKKAEFRFNDRNYEVGDILCMREFDRGLGVYLNEIAYGEVTDVCDVSQFCGSAGWVMVSFNLLNQAVE